MGSLTTPNNETAPGEPTRLGVETPTTQADGCRSQLLRQVALGLASQGIRSIALFGAGRHTRVILRQPWNDAGIEVKLILDDAPSRPTLGGIPIVRPIPGQPPECIQAIVLSSEHYEDQLEARANELYRGSAVPIFRIYRPDLRLQVHAKPEASDKCLMRVAFTAPMCTPDDQIFKQRRYELARELLDEMAGSRVADLSCGTGEAAQILTNDSEIGYTGVDDNAIAIESAQKLHGGDRRQFICAPTTATPLADRSVDLITSFEAIKYIEHPSALIAECDRVLSERGLLIISTPCNPRSGSYPEVQIGIHGFIEALSTRFEVLNIIGQCESNTVFDPDLPPGMWMIDPDTLESTQEGLPDHAVLVARHRGSNRPRPRAIRAHDTVRVWTRHGSIPFFCPTDTVRWRAQTLLTKEPETIEWIDSFERGDIFWDIGASTGPYSMYAAYAGKTRQIIALEPSPWNWWVLAEQVRRSGLSQMIRSLPVAASERMSICDLHMRHPIPGGAGSSFEQPIGELGEIFHPQFSQPSLGLPIDEMINHFGIPAPSRLKIDVDGNELLVLKGAASTLNRPQLRSVLVELENSRADLVDEVTGLMRQSGLDLVSRSEASNDPDTVNPSICNYRFDRA